MSAIGIAGQGLVAVSSRLLAMTTNYLAAGDSVAAAFTSKINLVMSPAGNAEGCEPSNAAAPLRRMLILAEGRVDLDR